MKLVKTEEAVGQVLCHDITQIIRGVTKDAVFRKGHIVTEEDIPVLLSVGKEHLYVWENDDTMLHENDAADILRELCQGAHMHASEVKEGKIELISDMDGLLKVDRKRLDAVNSFGEMMIATRHGNFAVKKGDKLAGTRIIPLVIKKEKMEEVRKLTGERPILEVKPFAHKKVGIVTTGSEVLTGRIADTFTPVLEEKLAEYDTEIIGHELSGDDAEKITASIRHMLELGADLVLCSGGMSVDPDDRTPLAIRTVTGEAAAYGAPVLPGAMFMIGYYRGRNQASGEASQTVYGTNDREDGNTEGKAVPVIGLPGCVMYSKRTIFDLILPRVMADDPVTAEEISRLGEGGLCLNCPVCTFPNCGFGKGGA